MQWQIVPRLGGRLAEAALSKTSVMSLGLVDPILWLIARRCDDLAVSKLVEEGLICIMKLCQCYLWLSELTNTIDIALCLNI